MNPPESIPRHCRPEAFDTLARQLDAIDTTRGLVRCAVAVSMHQLPDADPAGVEGQIDALAGTIGDRVQNAQPRALLAHAHAVLFDEARFAGNTEDYHHPDNSYLPRLLDTRQGLPLTLVLLYKAVLESLGLRVLGINAPGHFLAGVIETAQDEAAVARPAGGKNDSGGKYAGDGDASGGGGLLLIDPFHGGVLLTREEAFARIESIAGGSVMRHDSLLRPATHTQWLIRLIQNLVTAFDKRGRRDDMAAMLEMRTLVESAEN